MVKPLHPGPTSGAGDSPNEDDYDLTPLGAVGGHDDDVNDEVGIMVGLSPGFAIPETMPPDRTEHVERQTEEIVGQFIHERYRQETRTNLPDMPDYVTRPQPNTPEYQIARTMAVIGDDINARYSGIFNEMIKLLPEDGESTFDTFRNVAMMLFRNGQINWGRVIALLFFGYKLVIERVNDGASEVISRIVKWVVQFLITEKITKWIADHGGWGAILALVPSSVSTAAVACIIAAAGCFALAAFFLARQ